MLGSYFGSGRVLASLKSPGNLSFESESDFDERALRASWTSPVDMGVLMVGLAEIDPPVGAFGVIGLDRATRAYPRMTEGEPTTADKRAEGVVSESLVNRCVSEVVSPETALCACAHWCCLGKQSREVMSGDVGFCPRGNENVCVCLCCSKCPNLESTFFIGDTDNSDCQIAHFGHFHFLYFWWRIRETSLF